MGFKNMKFCQVTNNIHDLLVMFEKQDIPTKLQKEEIETLKYESDLESSYVKFKSQVIVTWFCENYVSHIYSSKGLEGINKTCWREAQEVNLFKTNSMLLTTWCSGA